MQTRDHARMSTAGPLSSFNFQIESRTYASVLVHGKNETESFQGKVWRKVDTSINWVGQNNKLWLSLGADLNREKIFFDENSKIIQDLKVRICKLCHGKSISKMLLIVNALVNTLTANQTTAMLETRLKAFLNDCRQKQKEHVVSLHMDEIIANKLLVCRHKALIVAALLRELVEQKILPFGKVRQYRSKINIPGKPFYHSWTVYRNESTGHLWICDAQSNLVQNVNSDFDALISLCTREALAFMIERVDEQDVYLPLLEKLNKYSVPFCVQAVINNSHAGYPGINICFKFNRGLQYYTDICKALKRQGIWFNRLNDSLYIPLIDNPKIFNMNVEQLMHDIGIVKEPPKQISLDTQLHPDAVMPPTRTLLFAAQRCGSSEWGRTLAKHGLPYQPSLFRKRTI